MYWQNGFYDRKEKVLLIVSDNAKSMVKAVRDVKKHFPNTNHVTCLVHALHRVCEKLGKIMN